ncbi:MAG: hypothetical protein JSV82_06865 [Planctomycetota bacterium]|nr:MAG: hypothetical protein JSV82_06865 [Planctomycetota bacterium]
MKDNNDLCTNRVCGLNRREFLGGCAACVAGFAGASVFGIKLAMAQAAAAGSSEKAKVRLIFTHEPPENATWPYIGFDYEGRKKELTDKLRKACPYIEFLSDTAKNTDDAKKILEADKEVDGYLIYMLGLWTQAPQTIAASSRPTLFVDDLYGGSGEFLSAIADARRKKLKVTGVSSTRFEDVVEAVKCFDCIKKLRSSVILNVGAGPDWWGHVPAKVIEQDFGLRVVDITFEQLDEAYKKADQAEAVKWADRWMKNAEKIVEPSRQTIEKSGAMYLAMRDLMNRHKAQAITVNCLGGFYGGHMTAYPCLGFFQLNNDGLVGTCEADMVSTFTTLIMAYLVKRPGYISDPVIDTAKNQVIYAHCVAPNKVFGPDGPTNPYHIRSHSEDRKGAAIRSLLPLGEMTTTVQFDPQKKKVLLHQGKSVANIDEDKACRTKLAVEVKGDIDKLLNYWDQWGWHRVTYYGDLKRPVEHIAALLGYEVVEEA